MDHTSADQKPFYEAEKTRLRRCGLPAPRNLPFWSAQLMSRFTTTYGQLLSECQPHPSAAIGPTQLCVGKVWIIRPLRHLPLARLLMASLTLVESPD